jgi:S-adenosylmethionine synthetase
MAQSETFVWTSESVTEGHPDKMCDIVSDSILDAYLKADPRAKVACETCAGTGFIHVFGEVSYRKTPATQEIDIQNIVREAVAGIGYTSSELCLDARTMSVMVSLHAQSPDIAAAVHEGRDDKDIGAGDQGMMFGYATDETPEMMPLTHQLAHALAKKLTEVRKSGECGFLGPDGKTQVTVEYEKTADGVITPKRIDTILISTMHKDDILLDKLRQEVREKVVDTVVPAKLMDENTKIHINPAGRFVVGGSYADAGLTGRKIIVDTYGGWGAHGGGAFSGKDPSKVDRSACYAARWVAKSIVSAGLAKRVLVQVSYAIGSVKPTSVFVDTYGTGTKSNTELKKIINDNFDLSPAGIVDALNLKSTKYAPLAAYGHFGRSEAEAPWEKPKVLSY